MRSKQGLDHKHCPAACMQPMQLWQLKMHGDVYTRRNEGVSIWVVESKYIHASNRMTLKVFTNLQTTKYIDIQLFMTCPTR
jgi:phenylacetate-CoA oxygenase PaaH subunit